MFLPMLQHDLNCLLSGNVTTLQLHEMSNLLSILRILMRKKAIAKD